MLALSPKVAVPAGSPSDETPGWEPLEVGTALIDSRPECGATLTPRCEGSSRTTSRLSSFVASDFDDVEVDDGLPAGMRPRAHILSVRPHEVERGDFLVGLPRSMVAGVLYDGAVGRWLYTDSHGIVFASRKTFEQVQVVRDLPPVPLRVRPLQVVR